jgi:hypothetical protein
MTKNDKRIFHFVHHAIIEESQIDVFYHAQLVGYDSLLCEGDWSTYKYQWIFLN